LKLTARTVLLFAALAALALLNLQCAETAPPPGGEPDRTGPRLLRSEPASGEVSVPPSDRITLHFSEHVVEPRTKDVVFITPRQSEPPKLRWRGDRLEIQLAEPFRDNTTYILSVSSDVADLRGNRLDSSLSMAFSTGPTIDSGRIGGIVLDRDKPQAGILVGLYDRSRLDSTTAFDAIYPDYLSQTNASGRFELHYLPPKDYRLIAFKDANRDERFNPMREQWAVPTRPIDVQAQPPMDSLYLVLAPPPDTTTPKVIAATGVTGSMVKIRLSSEIPLNQLSARPSDILLSSVENPGRHHPALGFLEFRMEKTSTISAYFGALADSLFRLEVTHDAAVPPMVKDSVRLRFPRDETPPAVAAVPFHTKELFLRDVELYLDFTEPLDSSLLTTETFTLVNRSDSTVPVEWRISNPFSIDLIPQTLVEAEGYTLTMVEFEIGDLAGNLLGDSLREYRFSTYDPDQLGMISGSVTVERPGHELDPVLLTFTRVGDKAAFDLTVTERVFSLSVPAGKYLLHGFADSDDSGERSLGNIQPERYAEPIDWYPDTIAVRARFETAGVEFIIR